MMQFQQMIETLLDEKFQNLETKIDIMQEKIDNLETNKSQN